MAKSLGDYRGGDFESAIVYAKKSRPPEKPHAYREATALLVQAMAQHQLDRAEQAAQSLAEALAIMNEQMPTPETGELDRNWPDWLRFHTLRREAENLIEPKETANSEQKELSKN